MVCPNCTNEIPEGRKACGYCGVKILSAEKFLCPNCEEELPAGVKVCGYCGTKMEKPAVVERKTTPKKKEKSASAPKPKRPASEKKPARIVKPETKVKKKISVWIFGVAMVLVAVGAYFLFFRYQPSVDCLYGDWAGQVYLDGENIFNIQFVIGGPCENNAYCGTFSIPMFDAIGRIKIIEQRGSKFYFFAEPNAGKPASEIPDEYLQCKRDGTLFYESSQNGGTVVPSGTLWPK